MTTIPLSIICVGIAFVGITDPAWADVPNAVSEASGVAQCHALQGAGFSGVIDAPTQVTDARLVEASSEVPAHCEISGYVAPTIGFLLKLPVQGWNGKFFEAGCGGFCGGVPPAFAAYVDAFFVGPLRRGYAALTFDSGHATVVSASASWAYNNLQAQMDFGFRSAHVAALAGKAITERYYGKAPAQSYFSGCSTGGGQALSEAQRFPWDFDGIISGAPSPTFSGPMMYYLWAGRVLAGTMKAADLRLVHEAAVAKCDLDDGIRDGVIGDPLHCRFDPAQLLCKAGENAQCLTAAQVAAVRKVYSGPTTSKGEKIYTGGPLPGSELNWIPGYVDDAGVVVPWSQEYFSYVGFMPAPGPGWNPADFDFDRDYKRLRMAESLFGAADNPDLRKFKAAGGKLILYQGGADESDIPTDAIDYYETVQKTLGGRAATQDFFRLFVIPGMNHCSGGAGAFAIDYLTYLEDWVEKGRAPDKLIGAHVTTSTPLEPHMLRFPLDPSTAVSFTRPIYPYPVRAKYKGSGDPNSAASFGPVAP